ncbi:MAG: guanylate kinase [Clostridiales bacterium]|nr:guanylate kinase [Clostridiales bacterium]
MRNVLFVISGPSGVGKGTLVKLLLKEDPTLALSVSCTTRSPREGEENGREYYFISKEEFAARIAANDFFEYDEHFGNFYGTPRTEVKNQLDTKSVILEIDVVGGLNVKKLAPDVVLILIAPPSAEELVRRLHHRDSESEEAVALRLRRMEYELAQKKFYDYTIVNDDLMETKKKLQTIILFEKNRTEKEIKHD